MGIQNAYTNSHLFILLDVVRVGSLLLEVVIYVNVSSNFRYQKVIFKDAYVSKVHILD